MKKFLAAVIFFIFITSVVGLMMLNKWLQSKVGNILNNPIKTSTIKPYPPVAFPQKIKEILRKTKLAPERTFAISIFYQDGKEIAGHKTDNTGKIYDQTGTVPSGFVKFVNESDETYGGEYYQNGQRHGPLQEYFKDGSLKRQAYFQDGRLMTSTEYYHDGTVRMTKDYTDAREHQDAGEVGRGKVFFRDGRLKYEWQMTNSDPVGYYKSYNAMGQLTSTVYYNKDGEMIASPKMSVNTTIIPPDGL